MIVTRQVLGRMAEATDSAVTDPLSLFAGTNVTSTDQKIYLILCLEKYF